MLNIQRGSLYVFGPAFKLIFICAVLAGAALAQNKEPEVTKNPPRKPVVSKPGKTPPKLKPAPRTAKLVTAKKNAKAAAAPGGETEHSLAAPAEGAAEDPAKTSAVELKVRTKEKHTITTVSEIPAAKTGAAKKAPVKAVKFEVKEKSSTAAAATAAKKAEPKTKASPKAGEKAAAKVTPKVNAAPAVTAAKKPEVKKSEAKKETAVAAAPVKRIPAKKKTAPALTAETKTKDPSETAPARAPVKAWLPRITAENVRAGINGKTIADIPSEEAGDGTADWLFAPNQPKEIEILNTDQRGDVLTVEARVSAKKTRANLDGSYDHVRGVARLYYLRGNRKWELKRVDNVSLRHGDTGLDSPLPGSSPIDPNTAPNARGSVISAPPLNILPEGGRVDVAAGKYRSYSFRVEKAAVVTGRFQAQGGGQNDIEAYILDQDGFLNWSNNHSAPAYYNSGRLTVGAIETPLGPGTYYLVFNNRFSRSEGKLIDAGVTLRTDNAYLARFDRTGQAYNGAGIASGGSNSIGAVNTIRRIYGPGASPAPAYTPPTEAPEKRDANMAAAKIEPPVKPQMTVAGYESDAIFSGSFRVDNGDHRAVAFSVRPGGVVRGTFMVVNGGFDDQNIDAYIMSAREYERWNYSREGVMDYSSGRVGSARVERKLEPGDYYLVFSNHFSQREPKTVKAEIHVEYLPR